MSAIANVMERGDFINGREVKQLETELEKYTDAEHCICVGNGTDALQLALMAIDIQPGD